MGKLQFNTFGNEAQKTCFRYLLGHPEITEIGYGGGAGGGKSYTGVAWQWMMRNKYPGTRGFFGRQELKRLKQTTLATYFKFLDDYNIPESQRGVYNSQDSVIRFLNGSEILLLDLAYLPSDPLYTRFGSLELTDGYIDESAEIAEQCITIIMTRIGRQKNEDYGLPPKLLEGFNPDRGHVYRRYYKPYKDGTMPYYRVFIPALATDNKRLPKSYIEQLKKADEVTKQRLLYGNFDYDDNPGKLFDYNSLLSMEKNEGIAGKKYITIDVAREGKDRTVLLVWNGFIVEEKHEWAKNKLDDLAEEVRAIMHKHSIGTNRVIADESGVGGGLVDILRCVGFVSNRKQIEPRIQNIYAKTNYENLKAQCVHRASQAVNRGDVAWKAGEIGTIVEELDSFTRINIDKDARFQIIRKEDQKEKLGRSPDYADAFIMRFFFCEDGNEEELTFMGLPDFIIEYEDNKRKEIVTDEDFYDAIFGEEKKSTIQDVELSPY